MISSDGLGPSIGPYRLRNPVVLAPMAGVTDAPFRALCWRLGVGYVVSEMVSSNPRLRETRKSSLRRRPLEACGPHSVQIAGGDPASVAEAARFNVEEGAQIIDINMGCPAKKVCNKAAGSALLKDEGLVVEILKATVAAVSVPVTLKIRTGWSPEHRNGVRVARLAEDAGIAALAVHGRTRADRFLGAAEYDTIAEIVKAVSIPVFANGDICSPEKALSVLGHTNAAGIMIGRAAQGRPWFCGQVAAAIEGAPRAAPSFAEQGALLSEHVAALHDFYGPIPGARIARKHVGWALADLGEVGEAFRRRFNRIEAPEAQLEALSHFYGARRAAA